MGVNGIAKLVIVSRMWAQHVGFLSLWNMAEGNDSNLQTTKIETGNDVGGVCVTVNGMSTCIWEMDRRRRKKGQEMGTWLDSENKHFCFVDLYRDSINLECASF